MDIPLIWTADFMLDYDENGGDKYVLGEFNCSCAGFNLDMEIQDHIAREAIKRVEAKYAILSDKLRVICEKAVDILLLFLFLSPIKLPK